MTLGTKRIITDHHDGHGLNEALTIMADQQDPNSGCASHHYEVVHVGEEHFPDEELGGEVATIQFQQGPSHVAGSVPGVTEAVLLAILIDRMRGFQAGPFSCRENAIILTKLEECLHWTKARADARAKRGVLGKNEK